MNEELQNIEAILKLMNRVELKGSEVPQYMKAQEWLVAQARKIQMESAPKPVAVPKEAPKDEAVVG